MALELGLRALLDSGGGDVSVEAAMQLLDQAEGSGAAALESVSPEAYLLCAERAIEAGRPDLARSAAERFLNKSPPKDQFLARAYFVFGRVQVQIPSSWQHAQHPPTASHPFPSHNLTRPSASYLAARCSADHVHMLRMRYAAGSPLPPAHQPRLHCAS
jgi:hypothetical protein